MSILCGTPTTDQTKPAIAVAMQQAVPGDAGHRQCRIITTEVIRRMARAGGAVKPV
jgi:hypothetical protein